MSAPIDCPVCLNAITDLVNCATTLCGHKFHTSCLLKCVSHGGFNCPYCRSNMDEEEEEEEPVVEPVPEPVPEPVRQPVRSIHLAQALLDRNVEEERVVVRKMKFNGINYLVATRTGEVYDYNEYVSNGEQIEVGRWNLETREVELFE